MSRKIVIITSCILLLIISNVYFLQKNTKQNLAINQLMHKYQSINIHYDTLIKLMEYRIAMSVENEGKSIYHLSLDSINFKSSLFLRFNTQSCQMCIEHVLNSIKSFETCSHKNIVIIGTFDTATELKYYKKNKIKSYQLINIENESLFDSKLEKNKVPYFFTINKNKKMKNLFIPDKNFPRLTYTYLKNILPCLD